MESKRKLTKNYANIENNKNILFCTGIFRVGQMHYGPPKEIFGWAMAHPKYRVAPPNKQVAFVVAGLTTAKQSNADSLIVVLVGI
jgi:hypothetical protein